MAKVTLNKLNLKPQKLTQIIKIDEIEIEVKQYLPIMDKTQLIQYVVDSALDETTGCFSPVRLEVYFSLALCRWYAGITFTEKQLKEADKSYDLLEENHIVDYIREAIPRDEFEFISDLVQDTTADIARYNSSAAGIIQSMNNSAGGLNSQISEIFEKIKTEEGAKAVGLIKNMAETL